MSGDPCIECSCDTVGWRGDLAKVASLRSLPELGLGRVEGAPVAWGGPRARREFAWDYCSCPRLDLAAVDLTLASGTTVGAGQAVLFSCQVGQWSGEVTAVTSALSTEERASG